MVTAGIQAWVLKSPPDPAFQYESLEETGARVLHTGGWTRSDHCVISAPSV